MEPRSGSLESLDVATQEALVEFLLERLREELAGLWDRAEARTDPARYPGLVAQIALLDDLILTLSAGHLPASSETRMMLYGYGTHPDYQPAWTTL